LYLAKAEAKGLGSMALDEFEIIGESLLRFLETKSGQFLFHSPSSLRIMLVGPFFGPLSILINRNASYAALAGKIVLWALSLNLKK